MSEYNTTGTFCTKDGSLCEHNLVDAPLVKKYVCSGLGGKCNNGEKFSNPNTANATKSNAPSPPRQVETRVRQCEPECEDCGEPTKRRTRCELCGYLICGWCRNHVHNAHIQQAISNNKTLEKELRASA